ncbi:amino acid ABC transporter permease [Paracoccus luteus]|uniref:amino acid ABC transporter permease n=1 Tax=Paracoccus luteus TaxID=2508543 RepID=UPI00106FFB1E|nr:amino acid ABC transporter permease [Paracoccus luteus]
MFWFYLERVLGYWPVLLKGLGMTIGLSLLSLVIGVAIGFAFGIIRAGRNRWLSRALGLYIDLFRATPFLVQVFIVFFILPVIGIELSAFAAGVVALSNMAACFIGEIVAAGLKAVPAGQREAALASGMTRAQQMRLVVMPQAVRIITPSLVGQFVLLIKDSSVVSAIGLLDLTRAGWLIVQSVPNGLLVFGIIGIGYFIICYPLIWLSRRLERRSQAAFL